MAVTVLGVVESLRTDTSNPMTWTHNSGVTAPGGVLVGFMHGTSSTDHVQSVTYGDVPMQRVQRNVDTATEPGAAEWWFLGEGRVPPGSQTVSAALGSATTDDIHGVSITLGVSAGSTCVVVDVDGLSDTNGANPSVTLQYLGKNCMAFAAFYSGLSTIASITAGASCTLVTSSELAGNFTSAVIRQSTAGTSDFAIAATSAADDVAFAAVAVGEVLRRTLGTTTQIRAGRALSGRRYGSASRADAGPRANATASQPLGVDGGVGRRYGSAARSSTEYAQSVDGTLGPVGTVGRFAKVVRVGTLTSSGSALKRTSRALAGSLAMAGALAVITVFLKALAGTVTSAGTLLKQARHLLSGAVTSAGTVARRITRSLAGTVTSSGSLLKRTARTVLGTLSSSGTVANIRFLLRALSGSIGLAGIVAKRTSLSMAGTVTSAATIVRRIGKVVSGAITSSSTILRVLAIQLAGTLASHGSLSRTTYKAITAAIESVGALLKHTSRTLSGSISPEGLTLAGRLFYLVMGGGPGLAGQLAKRPGLSVGGGSVALNGIIRRAIGKVVSGSVESSGAMDMRLALRLVLSGIVGLSGTVVKQTSRRFSGIVTVLGTVKRSTRTAFAGAVEAAGAIVRRTSRGLAGAVESQGTLRRQVATMLAGVLSSQGTVKKDIRAFLSGLIGMAGIQTKHMTMHVDGLIESAGGVTKRIQKRFSGTIGLAGLKARLVIRRISRIVLLSHKRSTGPRLKNVTLLP